VGKSEKSGQDYSSIGSIVGSMYPDTVGVRFSASFQNLLFTRQSKPACHSYAAEELYRDFCLMSHNANMSFFLKKDSH
jgi:hypothetical protein